MKVDYALSNKLVNFLPEEKKQDYWKINFLDNQGYYRHGNIFGDISFTDEKEYLDFLKDNQNHFIVNGNDLYVRKANYNNSDGSLKYNYGKVKFFRDKKYDAAPSYTEDQVHKGYFKGDIDGINTEGLNDEQKKYLNLSVYTTPLIPEPNPDLKVEKKEEEKPSDENKPELETVKKSNPENPKQTDTDPPGFNVDLNEILNANKIGLLAKLLDRDNFSKYTPFKLPSNHITRPVDQPAIQNSMMNNLFSNNAFALNNRNLPAYLQQSFINNVTGKMYDRLPLPQITNYYNQFHNQQVNQHNNFLNKLYNAEKFNWDDQRRAIDKFRQGLDKSRENRINSIVNYLLSNAKLRQELPWKFIENGLEPIYTGNNSWFAKYSTALAEAALAQKLINNFKTDPTTDESTKKSTKNSKNPNR